MDRPKREKKLPARLLEPAQIVIKKKVNKIAKNQFPNIDKSSDDLKDQTNETKEPEVSDQSKQLPVRLREPEQKAKKAKVEIPVIAKGQLISKGPKNEWIPIPIPAFSAMSTLCCFYKHFAIFYMHLAFT